MKRFLSVISIIVCVIIMAFSLTACADAGAPSHNVAKNPDYAISADVLAQKLDEFMSDERTDRTTYTAAEKAAAEYLRDELVSYGYVDDIGDDSKKIVREFKTQFADGGVATSQNVVATYRPSGAGDNAPNVIIGAYYDNRYNASTSDGNANDTSVTRSHGALMNGTGVATLLSIAEYLQDVTPELDFTVTIVFFGASAINNTGVGYYYSKQMTVAEKKNTVLMIELQRLGGDHVYAFSDYRETRRESFFDKTAAANGLDIYKPTQKSPLMLSLRALNGVPFYQWAQSGNFSVFFNNDIPTLNLIGANWETVDFKDKESASDNIGLTKDDTLANLKKRYPDYAKKMATAATLVIRSLDAEGFIDAMRYDRDNFPNTDALASDWIWYAVVLGVLAISAAVMTLLTRRLSKKYPPKPVAAPVRRNVKMAVFGMEYEDKNSDDIFIDIKKAPIAQDEIFPGVPNNDVADDGIFPPLFPPVIPPVSILRDDKPKENINPEEPSKERRDESASEAGDGTSEKSDGSSVPTEEKPPASDTEASAEKHATQARRKSPSTARKTTSAGKSASAKKTVHGVGGKKPEAERTDDGGDKPDGDGGSDTRGE